MRFLTKLPSRPAPRRELFRRSPGSMGNSIGRPATPFAVYSAVKRANSAPASEAEQGAIRDPTRSETSRYARGLRLRIAAAGSVVVQNRWGHGPGVHHRQSVSDGLLFGIYSRLDRRSGKRPPRTGRRSMPGGPWVKGRRRQRVHSGDLGELRRQRRFARINVDRRRLSKKMYASKIAGRGPSWLAELERARG